MDAKKTIDGFQEIVDQNEKLKIENAELKEKVGTQEHFEKTIARLQKEQEEISRKSIENSQKEQDRIDGVNTNDLKIKEVLDEEIAHIEEVRALIEAEYKAFIVAKEEAKAVQDEYLKIKSEIELAKEEIKAREKEIAESKGARSFELTTITNLRAQQETELLKLNSMKEEALKVSEENKVILNEINSARDGAEKLMADINEARQKSEDRRIAAQNEVSSASYATETAKNMMNVFRQALSTYIQFAGSSIQIPEITDEHRRFIAKDLLSQCADTVVEVSEVSEEIEELTELRKQYKEKFQKNYFPGWGVEELKSKLQ